MNTEPDNVSSDVAAAFAAASADPGAAPATPTPTPRDDGRYPNGQFAPATPTAPAAPSAPAATPAPTAATPTPDGQPAPAGSVPAATPPAAGTPPAGAVTLDPSKPPQGWRPEAKAKWETLPEDLRTEIIRREGDSARGVERLRQFYQPMEQVYEAIAPHAQYFQHIQRNPQDYLREVIQMEQSLTLGNPAQKLETVLAIGEQYGIPLRQIIDASMNGQLAATLQQSHQRYGTPAPIPPHVQQEINRLRQLEDQHTEQLATAQLNEFLSTNPPFFNEVGEEMEKLLDSGVVDNYKDAYDLAVWRNPTLHAQAQAVTNGQNMVQGVQQRQAAAAAISTPGAAPIVPAAVANDDESVEDTVRRAMAQAQRPGGV